MKLYLVERIDDGGGYDTYSDFVCWANSEEEARWTAPDPEYHMWKDGVYCYSYREQAPVLSNYTDWVKDPVKDLKVTELNDPSKTPVIVCASFHAG